jgi:hypothetical protein
MKLICLNNDMCGETYVLNDEDYKLFNLSKKFHKCSQCSSLAILVTNDFFFSTEEESHLKMYLRILIKNNENLYFK